MNVGVIEILIVAFYVILALGFVLAMATMWRLFRYLGRREKERKNGTGS